jgi:hypothetical protein
LATRALSAWVAVSDTAISAALTNEILLDGTLACRPSPLVNVLYSLT